MREKKRRKKDKELKRICPPFYRTTDFRVHKKLRSHNSWEKELQELFKPARSKEGNIQKKEEKKNDQEN